MKIEESEKGREPMTDSLWRSTLAPIRAWLAALAPPERERARRMASEIGERLEWLDAPMAEHCRVTCPECDDPCCAGLRVFYNQADLIYLSALGETLPPGQTRRSPTEDCRYLSREGCGIPRIHRPYVCVWFLCEPQLAMLSRDPPLFQRRFIAVLGEIRTLRLQLETWFESGWTPETASLSGRKPGRGGR